MFDYAQLLWSQGIHKTLFLILISLILFLKEHIVYEESAVLHAYAPCRES
jgi:hypothetical protein